MRTLLVTAIVLAVFTVAQSRTAVDDTAELENFLKKVQDHHEKVYSRQKRQTMTTCPYCDPDVWMAYPDWTDCTRFIYCYGGTVTTYSCNTVMGDLSTMWYFNPTDKICERVQKPSNSCLFRSFDLRTVTM